MQKKDNKISASVTTGDLKQLVPERILKYDNRDYIPFGEHNLFPQELAKIGREAPTHRALLNSKTQFCTGNGFISENVALISLIDYINNDNESLSDVTNKVLMDKFEFGNAYINIVTDKQNRFVNLYHIDSTKVRLSKSKESVILHPDWFSYRNNTELAKEIAIFPNWTEDNGYKSSIIHIKKYEPTFTYYGLPDYYSALNSALIERATIEYNKNELKNTFSISGMLVVPGINDTESAKAMEHKLKEYVGSANNSKLLSLYLPDKATGESRDKAELIDFRKSLNGSWLDLHNQAQSDLLKAHRWYPNLAGFPSSNGFDTNVILNEYNVAMSNIIKPEQENILMILYKIFNYFNIDSTDLQFINESPVQPIKADDMKFVWEIRRDMGMEYDPNDINQQKLLIEINK